MIDMMIVVQDQDETLSGRQHASLSQIVDLVAQNGACGRDRRQRKLLQQRHRLGAGIGEKCADGGDQIGERLS